MKKEFIIQKIRAVDGHKVYKGSFDSLKEFANYLRDYWIDVIHDQLDRDIEITNYTKELKILEFLEDSVKKKPEILEQEETKTYFLEELTNLFRSILDKSEADDYEIVFDNYEKYLKDKDDFNSKK